MRISDWSSDVCSSDLIGWQYEGAAERVHRHILLDRSHLNAGQMTFLRAHQIQRRLQPRLLAAVPVDVQQDRFHGISPFPWKRSLGLDRKSTRRTPVTNAHLVCRLLLEKKKNVENSD